MNRPQRKRNRLPEYDYGSNGAYFLTVCTKNRACCLSKIQCSREEAAVSLSSAGEIVASFIQIIPQKYPSVHVDHYVIMPNHIHLLIRIDCACGTGDPSPTADRGTGDPSPAADRGTGDPSPAADRGTGDPSPAADRGTGDPSPAADRGTGDPSPTIGRVMGWLKYQTAKEINAALGRDAGPFWQRSYL